MPGRGSAPSHALSNASLPADRRGTRAGRGSARATGMEAPDAQAPAGGGGLELRLLGGFELRDRNRPVDLPHGAQRLLAFLALHERPLSRAFVAGTIWMDASSEHASANLRTALWRVRRPERPLVETTQSQIRLVSEVDVDVRVVTSSARRALERHATPGDIERLCASGDLLPDCYDDWLLIERERFRQLRLHALEVLCDALTAAGEFGAAADAAYAAIACEPLRESAHRALIRTHIAEGNPGEALRQYEVFRQLIASGLQLVPSEAMERLVSSAMDRGRPRSADWMP